jgi:hypothetical protein
MRSASRCGRGPGPADCHWMQRLTGDKKEKNDKAGRGLRTVKKIDLRKRQLLLNEKARLGLAPNRAS